MSETSSTPDRNKQAPPAKAPAARRSRLATGIALVALLVALLALADSAYLWWRLRALTGAEQTAVAAMQKVDRQAAAISALKQQVAALGNQAVSRTDLDRLVRQDSNAEQDLQRRIDALTGALAQIRQRLGGGRAQARLDDAAYLLHIAQHQARIVHNPAATVAALTAADAELANLNRPGVQAVRDRIAAALAQLNNASRIHVGTLARQLASLASRVDSLPLEQPSGTTAPAAPQVQGQQAKPQHWWQRVGDGLARAFDELVTVRHDDAVAPLLGPRERYFLYRNLTLELDAARLSALLRDGASFRASIERAEDWLTKYFDANAQAVRGMLAQLKALEDVKLETELPDITPAITALKQLRQPAGKPQ